MEVFKEDGKNEELLKWTCCVSMAEMIAKSDTVSYLCMWWSTYFGTEILQVAGGYKMKRISDGRTEDALYSVEDLINEANDLNDDAIESNFPYSGYVTCPNCVARFVCRNKR